MLIARQAVYDFLDRELDSWEWMKKLSRDQLLRELEALKVKPRFKRKPWLHQLVCIYLGTVFPRFLFLLDMGGGKTGILANLIAYRKRAGDLDKALVTVPRIMNIYSWVEGIPLDTDLAPWPIDVSNTEEKWHRLLHPQGDVTIIDVAGLALVLCEKPKKNAKRKRGGPSQMRVNEDRVRELLKVYNLLGIDEIHKLARQATLWYDVMDSLSAGMDFAYGMTGTMFGKNPMPIYPQVTLVDRGETFGETMGPFRAAFFDIKQHAFKGVAYKFRPDRTEDLHRMLQHRSIVYDEHEMHDLPPMVPHTINFEMTEEQRGHYMQALENLVNCSGDDVTDAYWLRMRQIVSGYLEWKDDTGNHILYFEDNPKLDGLESLVLDDLTDSKVIICYEYTPTGRMIVERLRKVGIETEWLYGGTKDKAALRKRILDPRGPRVLVMNTEAGGTGNDGLQYVSRYMVFYETPTDPIPRKQAERRLKRPGQDFRSHAWDLVMRGSLDPGILKGIAEGVDVHNAVVKGKFKNRGFFLGR